MLKDMTSINYDNLTYLDKEGYYAAFDKSWGEFSKSFHKLETLPEYNEGGGHMLKCYQDGDYEGLGLKLKEFEQAEMGFNQKAIDAELVYERIHLVPKVFTPYLEYEWYTYVVSERMGETILAADISTILHAAELRDFVCFDEKIAYILDFRPGTCQGAWVAEGEDAKKLMAAYYEVRKQATDYKDWFELDPDVLSWIS